MSWFLTAPENPISRRRGDPLGLRNITDEMSNLLAPGLTNRTFDARWLSILSWSLVQSQAAWIKAGNSNLQTAEDRRRRYEWLRPLELLWVKRSIHLGGSEYSALQWPGSQSLAKWDDCKTNFGMTERQLRNHRQLGAYGAYRSLLRTAGFTSNGDGWTPNAQAQALASIVDIELGKTGPGKRRNPKPKNPALWWLSTGWERWNKATRDNPIILTPKGSPIKLLPDERKILKEALFKKGSDRLRTAKVFILVRDSKTYVSLCKSLGDVLATNGGDARVKALGNLASLTETGLGLLRALADSVIEGEGSLTVLADNANVEKYSIKFSKASEAWLRVPKGLRNFTNCKEADTLAGISKGPGGRELLGRFLDHHLSSGTGVRWLLREGDCVSAIGAESGTDAGTYGYRLHALARLAVQCGVIEKGEYPLALKAVTDAEEDDE